MVPRRAALLGLCALLGGCGFRPLLKPAGDTAGVREELAAVQVPALTGRVGYLVRDGLLDQLNPTGAQVPSRYQLAIRLRRRTAALGIQLNNTITRFNLTVIARFSLLDASSQRVLYSSTIRRVASYNAIRAPYAELSAELDAERRAAREVSNDIRTQLAIHFVRVAEGRVDPAGRPATEEPAPDELEPLEEEVDPLADEVEPS
jgi:LPS-assembly lipoprotein